MVEGGDNEGLIPLIERAAKFVHLELQVEHLS